MNNNEISIKDYVKSAYATFGEYVNNYRSIPSLMDGLKPSYRRLMYAAYKKSGEKNTKSAELVGDTAKYHPHAPASLEPLVAKLVNYGLFEGKGNWGHEAIYGDSSPSAATRYTSARLSPSIRSMINSVVKVAPHEESEIGYKMLSYIPTPIPLGLSFEGLFGIGLGCTVKIPSFSQRSLLEAYLKNDPKLLKYGGDLDISYSESDLKGIWTKGVGKIVYSYKFEESKSGGYIDVFGDPYFKGNYKVLNEWQSEGKITIEDLSSGRNQVRFTRGYNIKSLSLEDLFLEVRKSFTSKAEKCELNTSVDGKRIVQVPLKDWIDHTYKNYSKLLDENRKIKLESLNFSLEVYSKLDEFKKLVPKIDDLTVSDISKKIKTTEEVVKELMSKPISTLKRVNSQSKIDSINEEIKEIKAFDNDKFIKDIVS